MKPLLLRIGAVAAVLIAGVAGVWQYQQWPLRQLPTVDLSKSTRSVRESVKGATVNVRSAPRSGRSWGHLGLVLRAHDFGSQADACLRQAEGFDPQEMLWPYIRGVGLQAEHPLEAAACFRRAIELSPREILPRLRLAELELKQNNLDSAGKLFEESLELHPGDGRAMLGKAAVLAERGSLSEALDWAERANAAAPSKRAIVQLLADISRRLGRKEQTAKWLDRLKLLPAETQWDDALVAGVLELRRDPVWLAHRADELTAAGQFAEARALLEQVIADDPENRDWPLRLARILIQSQDFEAAAKVLESERRRGAESAERMFLLGVISCHRREWPAALTTLRESLKLDPQNAEAHFNLAQAHRALRQPTEARNELEQALVLKPRLIAARLVLAELLIANGELVAARRELQTVLSEVPNHKAAQELLRKAAMGQ